MKPQVIIAVGLLLMPIISQAQSSADNCQELLQVIQQTSPHEPMISKIMDTNRIEYPRYQLENYAHRFLQRTILYGTNAPSVMLNLLLPPPPRGAKRQLTCYGDVRFSDGTYSSLHYVLDRDPDGEEYWQYIEFDRATWERSLIKLKQLLGK